MFNWIKRFVIVFFSWIPIVSKILKTRDSFCPISLRMWFFQKIVGFNKSAYWPMHHSSVVTGVRNIKLGIGTAPGFSNGCYIQGGGKIEIGDYTLVGPNVGIISSNHDIYDIRKKSRKIVKIGSYCWLGMNSLILPGVELADHTIVAAGSIVTRSFTEGYCVLGGVPAKVIKKMERKDCVVFEDENKFHGYIPHEKFELFYSSKLNKNT